MRPRPARIGRQFGRGRPAQARRVVFPIVAAAGGRKAEESWAEALARAVGWAALEEAAADCAGPGARDILGRLARIAEKMEAVEAVAEE